MIDEENGLLLVVAATAALEAFAMDDGRSRLIVFLFRNPHLLEGGQGGQDGATNPDGIFALRRSNDLDLHGGRSQSSDLLLHAVSNARVHGSTTGQDRVGIQILTDVDIALHDRVVSRLMDTAGFHAQERRLEQSLGATESLVSDGDDLTVGQFVRLLQRCRRSSSGHFLLEVESNVAELLLDVTDNFTFGCMGKNLLFSLRTVFLAQFSPVVVKE